MPTNITKPNSAQFVVQFLSSATGSQIVPSSATLNVSYFSSLSAISSDIGMTLNNSFWTATWSSESADLGSAIWTVSCPDTTAPSATGTIRVIDP